MIARLLATARYTSDLAEAAAIIVDRTAGRSSRLMRGMCLAWKDAIWQGSGVPPHKHFQLPWEPV